MESSTALSTTPVSSGVRIESRLLMPGDSFLGFRCGLFQVSLESISNKMTSSNLACVFGLNLIWPSQGVASLSALVPLNLFTELLIEYYDTVFSTQEAPGEHVQTTVEMEQAGPVTKGFTKTGTPQASPYLPRFRIP